MRYLVLCRKEEEFEIVSHNAANSEEVDKVSRMPGEYIVLEVDPFIRRPAEITEHFTIALDKKPVFGEPSGIKNR